MGFTSLGLSAQIQKAIAEKGYSEPSPIQAQAIPAVLSGQDRQVFNLERRVRFSYGLPLSCITRLSE